MVFLKSSRIQKNVKGDSILRNFDGKCLIYELFTREKIFRVETLEFSYSYHY